jgi:hypothetical protein
MGETIGNVGRREFLGSLGAGAAAAALGAAGLPAVTAEARASAPPPDGEARRLLALDIRRAAAQMAYDRPLPEHPANGEEDEHPGRIANYSKGLPHDALGHVEPAAYDALLAALASGSHDDFEAIPLGGTRKLINPKAGFGFDLEGPDPHHLAIRPAPRIDGPEAASELAELYWMSLARDVRFTDYETHPLIAEAAEDLSGYTDFRGPKEAGRVTPATIFRGITAGDLKGPYLSQFLLKEIPYGSLRISQRQRTVVPGSDYLADFRSWLDSQNGGSAGPGRYDPVRRYIRSARDLAEYVHVDALYEAYLNACLILLGMGAPLDAGNPYVRSANQIGFGTFGPPHVLSLVTEVATRALKAVWYQKWGVHRRQRPEAMAGLVHNHLTGAATYPLHPEILGSRAAERSFARNGSYLLPIGAPEGSPTHPSYGAGHATVAGACVTILKAWFDESFVLPDPVVPNQAGTALVPYRGADAGELTVGGELNKVAANVATGRNMLGIHYRSDYSESIRLGEEIALGVLQEQRLTYHEEAAFTLTRFDGSVVTV